MTINQMQYFSTVCTYHNITTSAKLLFISQPALSASLSDLENEIGCKLLDRTTKGVYPTEEGNRLLSHVNAVLQRYALLQNEVPLIVQGQSTIRIGFRPYSGETQVFHLYRSYKDKYSDSQVFFNEMRNSHPALFLDEDQLDFLAAPDRLLPQDWREKYEYCPLGEMDQVRMYCHVDNPLAALPEIGVEDLDNCPIAFWEGHKETMNRLWNMMNTRGLHLKHIMMPQVSGIANLICNNIAVGLLNGDFVQHIDVIRGCPLKEELVPVFLKPQVQIFLLWKKGTERNIVKKQFIDFACSWAP